MAFAKKSSRGKYTTAFSFFIFVVLAVSTLVISGKFDSVITPFGDLVKSFASATKPNLTESFVDAFKADRINTDKWTVQKSTDARVSQTANNNLRMEIPTLADGGRPKYGRLVFNEVIKDEGDFRATAVVYRPIVTGAGAGATGIRFISRGVDDDEGALIEWRVNGSQSTVSFSVKGEDGKRLESQAEPLTTNIAVFRLDRINKKYSAFYKLGSDTTADTGWKALGQEQNANLGSDGKIVLFTHNVGAGDTYPSVAGRFDNASIRWEGSPSDRIGFSDAFANGVVASSWGMTATTGSTAQERASDKLALIVPPRAVANKPGRIILKRNQPVVKNGKDFAVQALLNKPVVTGEGTGATGISFTSAGNEDEAAQVRWVAGTDVSRVVFLVRTSSGTLVEREAVNLNDNVKSLTLRLTRSGDKYSGFYRRGDSDADFVRIGAEESVSFGADGKIGLFATNMGTSGKYPRVLGRFDLVNGSVAK